MPNWCDNDLTITGAAEDVTAFLAEALGKGEGNGPFCLDFNKIVPQPGTITRDMLQDPQVSGPADEIPDDRLWYFWRLEHWGTQWQPDGFQVEGMEVSDGRPVAVPKYNGQAEVLVNFATAWTPPLPVVRAMALKFPTLDFELRYFESGNAFNGILFCTGGQVQLDKEGDYFGSRGG